MKGTSSLAAGSSSGSGSSSGNVQLLPAGMLLLPPGESVDATVLFTPPASLLNAPAAGSAAAAGRVADSASGSSGVKLQRDVELAGALVVTAAHGQQQVSTA
jgi:hypothetical protein